MSFESPSQSEKVDPQPKSSESFERGGEKIAEEQGSLLERVFLGAFEQFSEAATGASREEWRSGLTKEVGAPTTKDEVALKAVELLEQVPFLGASFKMFQAGMGVDLKSRQKLDTKEALVRYGVGLLRFGTDFGDTFLAGDQGKFTLAGKTESFLNGLAASSSENPNSKKARVASSLRDFVRANKERVEGFEAFIEHKAREAAGK
jgi:hypothetical protein